MATLKKTYEIAVNAAAAGKTVGELKQEFKNLTAELNNVAVGSAEASALLVRLGQVKGEIKGLRDEVKALDPEKKLSAFNNFAQGVVGAFGVATAAAETLGLSSTAADEYVKKTQSVIAVLSSLEAIRNALDGETINAIKSTYKSIVANFALGESYTVAGAKAKLASITTRQALLATGIGAVVVLVGLLIANFDKVKEVGASIAAKFKPQFDAISAFIDTAIARARDLASALTFGLVDNAATAAKAAAVEQANALLAVAIEARTRKIAVLEAEGKQTFAIRARQLADELKLLKTGTEDEKKIFFDKYNELKVLRAQFDKAQAEAAKKAAAEQLATELAAIQARITVRTAEGRDTFRLQVELKQRELQALLASEDRNAAAIIGKRAEIEALYETRQREQAQKAYEQFKQRVTETEKLEFISEAEKAARLAVLRDQLGEKIAAGTAKKTKQLADEIATQAEIDARGIPSIGDRILVGLFGVSADQLDAVKEQIGEATAALQAGFQDVAGQLLDGAIADADARLQETQTRLQALDQQLASRSSEAEKSQAQLATATGARRDFLLQKLTKERAEEEKTRAARAQAAKEEQAAAKERHRLEVVGQKLTAGSTLVASAYNSVLAIQAALEAVKQGSKVPFPGNIIAIVASLAAVAGTVIAARNLGKSLKMADGGIIAGGSHASGNDVPVFGGRVRVEGGEMITPVDATRRNLSYLELIRTAGRTRTLLPEDFARVAAVRVLPPPARRTSFADGGVLPTGGAGGATGSPTGASALEAKLDRNNALLEILVGSNSQIAGHTGAVAAQGPPRLLIGPEQALAIEEQRQQARAIQQANRL